MLNSKNNLARFFKIAALSIAVFACTVTAVYFKHYRGRRPLPHFVILIPSYNNEKYCEWNLRSAIDQDYPFYRIIYVNDCSTDRTLSLVKKVASSLTKKKDILILDNAERKGALENIYGVIHTHVADDEVVVTLDGDDALRDPTVLTTLAAHYSNPKKEVWLTYGQFISKNCNKKGWNRPYPEFIVRQNRFREYMHIPSHLRTFRAWLFKKIKQDDLKYENRFFEMTWDRAFMIPMLEMAGERHECIQTVLYTYNDDNPISDHMKNAQQQLFLDHVIRHYPKYAKIEQKG